MISRRGLFRLLTGAVASPVLKPLAAMIPDNGICVADLRRCAIQMSGCDFLLRNLSMTKMCQTFDLPPRSGNQITFFTYVTKLKEEGAFEEPWETT